ncbi:MAG: TonB-dependent receptor [Spirosomataceae bacterium]
MNKKLQFQTLVWTTMKISFQQLLFCLLFCGFTSAHNTHAQELLNKPISIEVESTSLKKVLTMLEKQAKVRFVYSSSAINPNQRVSLKATNKRLELVLEDLLKPIAITFIVSDNHILLKNAKDETSSSIETKANLTEIRSTVVITEQTIMGLVTDENGVGLPGVSILLKGLQRGTTSDGKGRFTLNVPDNKAVLVFSFVGYLSQEVAVGNQTQLNILLQVDTKALEEVVVVGYGTAKKKDLTGAVASVNVEGTRLQPNTNATQMLRGTTAGVQVTDNGRPGQNGSIVIRGLNSISASNAPLIVLDGIIYAGGNIADINPNDIESIDILKDASSAAVYGSLAANGVIEITTKKGKSGKPKFGLNSYIGFSDYAFLPNYMNAEQYLAARKDAEIAEGGPVPFSVTEQANIAAGRSINPFQEIKQSAPMSNYELSVSGKTDRISYFFSGAYTTSKSPVKGDNFGRLSSRLNLGVQATDWLKIGINSGYSSRDNSGVRTNLTYTSYLSPYASLFLEDGVSPKPLPQDWGLVPNPILGTLLDNNKSITNVLFSNAYADVNIWKGLSYKLNAGYTRTDSKIFNYSPSYAPLNRLGLGSKRHGESQNFTLENIIKYQQKIAKNHNLDLTFLYGIYELKNQTSFLSSQNIFNDALGYNALEIGEGFNIDASASQNKQNSSMARLGYSISSKYFVTLSVRRDGYSAFGIGKKYGVFPALAFSWNMDEEPFLKNIKQIDFLKLRASWGRNGNRGVSEYSSLSQVGQSNYVFGDGSPASIGLSATTLANPNLGWETSESFNIGVDVQAFSNRITTSVNFYKTNTFDLLLNQTIPNTNGFETILRNIGETENHGFELDLKTLNLKKGDFSWNTNLAFSLNRNKILKLTGRDINKDGIEDDDIASGWFIGHPLGSNFDYVFDGIYQQGDDFSLIAGAKAGDLKFKDLGGPNGVPDGKITPDDRMVVSNNQPRFNMGITNVFSYKNISLSFFFNTRQGGYSSNSLINSGSNFYDQANFLNIPYWTPNNPSNTYPRINYRNPLGYGFYVDRSFTRLQDVSLSYNMPEKLISKFKIDGLQIYVSGKNVHTWTNWEGWDPEFGGGGRDPGSNGPLLKTFVGGINISF